MRGDWKSTTSLKGKQLLAVLAAKAQDKISSIDSGSLSLFKKKHQSLPCSSPPLVTVPNGVVPMDLDSMSAANTFTFTHFRALCFKKKICQHCGEQFDETHKKVWGCPNPKKSQIPIEKKIKIYKKWIDEGGKDMADMQPSSTASLQQISDVLME